jgi:hypothetical protein
VDEAVKDISGKVVCVTNITGENSFRVKFYDERLEETAMCK